MKRREFGVRLVASVGTLLIAKKLPAEISAQEFQSTYVGDDAEYVRNKIMLMKHLALEHVGEPHLRIRSVM